MPAVKQPARWIAEAVKNAAARIVIPFRQLSRNRVNPKGRSKAKIASPPPFLCFCPIRRQTLPSPRRGPNGMPGARYYTWPQGCCTARPGSPCAVLLWRRSGVKEHSPLRRFFAVLAAKRPGRETRPLQARPPGKCRGKRAARASCRGGVSPPASPGGETGRGGAVKNAQRPPDSGIIKLQPDISISGVFMTSKIYRRTKIV